MALRGLVDKYPVEDFVNVVLSGNLYSLIENTIILHKSNIAVNAIKCSFLFGDLLGQIFPSFLYLVFSEETLVN